MSKTVWMYTCQHCEKQYRTLTPAKPVAICDGCGRETRLFMSSPYTILHPNPDTVTRAKAEDAARAARTPPTGD